MNKFFTRSGKKADPLNNERINRKSSSNRSVKIKRALVRTFSKKLEDKDISTPLDNSDYSVHSYSSDSTEDSGCFHNAEFQSFPKDLSSVAQRPASSSNLYCTKENNSGNKMKLCRSYSKSCNHVDTKHLECIVTSCVDYVKNRNGYSNKSNDVRCSEYDQTSNNYQECQRILSECSSQFSLYSSTSTVDPFSDTSSLDRASVQSNLNDFGLSTTKIIAQKMMRMSAKTDLLNTRTSFLHQSCEDKHGKNETTENEYCQDVSSNFPRVSGCRQSYYENVPYISKEIHSSSEATKGTLSGLPPKHPSRPVSWRSSAYLPNHSVESNKNHRKLVRRRSSFQEIVKSETDSQKVPMIVVTDDCSTRRLSNSNDDCSLTPYKSRIYKDCNEVDNASFNLLSECKSTHDDADLWNQNNIDTIGNVSSHTSNNYRPRSKGFSDKSVEQFLFKSNEHKYSSDSCNDADNVRKLCSQIYDDPRRLLKYRNRAQSLNTCDDELKVSDDNSQGVLTENSRSNSSQIPEPIWFDPSVSCEQKCSDFLEGLRHNNKSKIRCQVGSTIYSMQHLSFQYVYQLGSKFYFQI